MALEPRFHPLAPAAGRYRRGHAHGSGLRETIRDARQQRLVFASPPVLVPNARQPFLAPEPRPRPRLEIAVWIESVVRPKRVLPHLERELGPVLTVNLLPEAEERRFAIDDQAVEVEDEGGKGHNVLNCRLRDAGCGMRGAGCGMRLGSWGLEVGS